MLEASLPDAVSAVEFGAGLVELGVGLLVV